MNASDTLILPPGWEIVALADISEIKGGVTVDKKRTTEGGRAVPYLRVANVQEGYLDLEHLKEIVVGGDVIDKLKLERGDILLNEGGDRDKLGRGWIWKEQIPLCIHQNHVFRARLKHEDILPEFVSYYANAFGKKYFFDEGKQTTNLASISLSKLKNLPLPLAPKNEQSRIVSKIEELFSDLDKGEESLRQAQAQLKRYRQSVLKAAVTGELTRDWREQNKDRLETGEALLKRILKARREAWEKAEVEKMRAKGVKPKDDSWKKKYVEPKGPDTTGLPELPEGWAWASLDMLAFIKGGVTVDKKRSPENPVEVPYLRVANVQDCNLDLNKIKRINVSPETIQELRLIPGDILLNEGGDLDKLGRGWVWEGQIPVCIHQNHVFRARLAGDIVSPFFVSYYASAMGKSFFMEKGKQTTNLASISLTKIKSLPVPISGTIENQHIIGRVNSCLQELEVISEEISIRASSSQALRQSILKSAFSGALVPQDPNDEPASELLKRIAAATAAPASPPSSSRTGPRQKKREALAPAKQAELPATPPQKQTASGLAQLRKAAGMSQAALAKAIGLNQAYISQMETGKRTITRDQAAQIASCLGVPLELLCGKTG